MKPKNNTEVLKIVELGIEAFSMFRVDDPETFGGTKTVDFHRMLRVHEEEYGDTEVGEFIRNHYEEIEWVCGNVMLYMVGATIRKYEVPQPKYA
jgi:hypothetical protein